MTKLDQEIQDKYFALFDVIAQLDAGLKQGTIRDLNQVRSLIAPVASRLRPEPRPTRSDVLNNLARANIDFERIFRPQPTRGSAPSNPATLLAKGEAV